MAPRTKTEHFLRLKGSSNPPTTLRALATQHQEPYGNVEARFKRASKASRNILDTTRGGTGLIPFKLGGCEYEASAVSLKFSKAEFILSFPWGDVLVIVDGTGQLFVCGEHFAIAMGYRGKSIMETRQVVRSKIHPAVPVKWKDLVTNELTLPEEQKAQLLQKYDSDGLWITQEAFVDWIATARKPDAVSFRRWFFQKCLDLILSSRLNARWEDMPLEQRTAVQARKDACELNKLLDDIMQPLGGSCTMVHTKVLDKLLGCTRTSFMEQVGINPKSHFSTPAVIKVSKSDVRTWEVGLQLLEREMMLVWRCRPLLRGRFSRDKAVNNPSGWISQL